MTPTYRCGQVVSHQEDCLALFFESFHTGPALLRKALIPYGQHLVEQQNVRIYMHRYRESQAHKHARGVCSHRRINKILKLGKVNDFVECLFDLLSRQTQGQSTDHNILPACQIGVEAYAQVQQGRNFSFHLNFAGIRAVDARQEPEQCALARSIGPNDAQNHAFRH